MASAANTADIAITAIPRESSAGMRPILKSNSIKAEIRFRMRPSTIDDCDVRREMSRQNLGAKI